MRREPIKANDESLRNECRPDIYNSVHIHLDVIGSRVSELEEYLKMTVLPYLWYRLEHEHQWTWGNAGVARWDRNWSSTCDGIAELIRQTTSLVGPVDPNELPSNMLVGEPSWFEQTIDKIGLAGIQYSPDANTKRKATKYIKGK